MANMSNAFGEITFESTSLEYLTVFVHYFQRVKSNEFFDTNLELIPGRSLVDDKAKIEKNIKQSVLNKKLTIYSFSDNFGGTGRYCFRNNLKDFFNLEAYKEKINDLTNYKYDDLINSISIKLHYFDGNHKNEFIEEVNATLVPVSKRIDDKQIYSGVLTYCDITDHEYTVDNLHYLLDYDEPCSLKSLLKHVDYFFPNSEDRAKALLSRILTENPHDAEKAFPCVDDLIEYFDIEELNYCS